MGVLRLLRPEAKSSHLPPRRSGSGPNSSTTSNNSSLGMRAHFCGPVRCHALVPSRRRRTVSEGSDSRGCGRNFPMRPKWIWRMVSSEKVRNKCFPKASLFTKAFWFITEAPYSNRPCGEQDVTTPVLRSARKSLDNR